MEREGGEERERKILYQIFQGDVRVLFVGGIVGETSKTVAHTGTRHLLTCGRRREEEGGGGRGPNSTAIGIMHTACSD